MIRFVDGDIFESGAEALVNPVNCVGVMGAGLARQFKERFPANYRLYARECRSGRMVPGVVLPTWTGIDRGPRWIINVPTKEDFRRPSRLGWVQDGLLDLARVVESKEIASVAIPMLGCGLGGLDWSDVRPLVVDAFRGLPDVDVMVYGPEDGR